MQAVTLTDRQTDNVTDIQTWWSQYFAALPGTN